jgi:hypothetical protein
LFELAIEIREVAIANFIRNQSNRLLRSHQQRAGIADSQAIDVVRGRHSGLLSKEPV